MFHGKKATSLSAKVLGERSEEFKILVAQLYRQTNAFKVIHTCLTDGGNWPEKPQTLQAHSIDHSCTTWPADVCSAFSCLQREQLLVFWCVLCSVPRGVSVFFLHNKTGRADHMASEVAARKCSHRLRGLRLCRLRSHSPPSSPIGKRGNSLIWFISSALIHWPVLLWALSVVWAKPAWEELQGNWLYCKFNQREPPKCSLL